MGTPGRWGEREENSPPVSLDPNLAAQGGLSRDSVGVCTSPSPCSSPTHTHRRGAAGSTVREPSHPSPLSHLMAPEGGGGEGKEALSWLWSLLLDALVLHKAGGGLQSSPQQAPGSQDHQGFFLSDNQSGGQGQPPPVSALPSPKPLPSLLPLLRSSPTCLPWERPPQSLSEWRGAPSLGSVPEALVPFLPLCPQSLSEGCPQG